MVPDLSGWDAAGCMATSTSMDDLKYGRISLGLALKHISPYPHLHIHGVDPCNKNSTLFSWMMLFYKVTGRPLFFYETML